MFFLDRLNGIETELKKIEKNVTRLRLQFDCEHENIGWEYDGVGIDGYLYREECRDCGKRLKGGFTEVEMKKKQILQHKKRIDKLTTQLKEHETKGAKP